MVLCCLRQILTLPSKCHSRNQDSSAQATFFQSSMVFCCCSLLFDMLCVEKFSSAYLGWNKWLFELLFPFYQLKSVWPFSSDINKAFFYPHMFFRTFSVNPRWLWVKIPVHQQFLKFSDHPVWHQHLCHFQSHLNHPFSPFWCSVWTSVDFIDHVYMHKCIELLPCSWLIRYLH